MADNSAKGAWYSALIEIDSSGKFKMKFDYDSKPEFGFEILDETFIADFQKFPRQAKHIPIWLKEILNRHQIEYK